MNYRLFSATVVFCLVWGCTPSEQSSDQVRSKSAPITYPATNQLGLIEIYHGTEVANPYRWLEDIESEEVANWVTQQNQITLPYLNQLPSLERYKNRLSSLWDYDISYPPTWQNGKYFYKHKSGLKDQRTLHVMDSPDKPGRLLIDPNSFSEDGTVSLGRWEVGPKAKHIAYTKSIGGSDWTSIHVLDIHSGEHLKDVITGVKSTSISWQQDGKGFFYSRYPQDSEGNWDDTQIARIHHHILGTEASSDKPVLNSDTTITATSYARVISENILLITEYAEYGSNTLYLLDLSRSGSLSRIETKEGSNTVFIDYFEGQLYFHTDSDAPFGRIVNVSLRQEELSGTPIPITEVVAEADVPLDYERVLNLVDGKLYLHYIKDVASTLQIYDIAKKTFKDIALPEQGTLSGLTGDADAPVLFYRLSSYINPGNVYALNLASGESSIYSAIDVAMDFSDYVMEQVFYASKDGTRVPMYVMHHKDIKLDGQNKTLLYGYGGFYLSVLPRYSSQFASWLAEGNVLAVANLRGGGEYGDAWYKAGIKLQKQNVFDDFIAAGEYLINKSYTQPDKLGIYGSSNGGLLIGAVLTQRPDLFGAALPDVGVMDILRYHLQNDNAKSWQSDLGISENQQEFKAQLAYSPLHNTQNGVCYPPTLVTTAEFDNRVAPWHSYKFAAAMQRDQGCDNPILLRVERDAGHGAGKPTWKKIEGVAQMWAFLDESLQ